MKYAHITGWGSYLPEKVVTNDALSHLVETSHEWIYQRTGICERRIASKHETTTTMAVEAAKDALAVAQVDSADIDLILVATVTPVQLAPATACRVQHELGATKSGCLDLNAACSGFIYGLNLVAQSIATDAIQNALIIGSETLPRYVDWQDRNTCALFGDGAGAVVLQGSDRRGGLLASTLGADGSVADAISLPNSYPSPQPLPLLATAENGFLDNIGANNQHIPQSYIEVEGRTVFQKAVQIMSDAIPEILDKASLSLDDVALFIPHQANARIIKAGAKKLGIAPGRFFTNIDCVANTSAASIPLALCDAVAAGRIETDDMLLFVGFGGGMTWGSSVIQWSADVLHETSHHRHYRNG